MSMYSKGIGRIPGGMSGATWTSYQGAVPLPRLPDLDDAVPAARGAAGGLEGLERLRHRVGAHEARRALLIPHSCLTPVRLRPPHPITNHQRPPSVASSESRGHSRRPLKTKPQVRWG